MTSCENTFLSSVSENVECENKCDHENESCSSTCIQNEIAKLKSQVERIEEKLDAILQKMDNNIIKNCDKMGDHIDFVNNVYDTVKVPLHYISNKVKKMIGGGNIRATDHPHPHKTVIEAANNV